MPKFSKRSLQNLENVHPLLVSMCHRAIEFVDFAVIEGHRDEEDLSSKVQGGKAQGGDPGFWGPMGWWWFLTNRASVFIPHENPLPPRLADGGGKLRGFCDRNTAFFMNGQRGLVRGCGKAFDHGGQWSISPRGPPEGTFKRPYNGLMDRQDR